VNFFAVRVVGAGAFEMTKAGTRSLSDAKSSPEQRRWLFVDRVSLGIP
jgi:hypothetical protein